MHPTIEDAPIEPPARVGIDQFLIRGAEAAISQPERDRTDRDSHIHDDRTIHVQPEVVPPQGGPLAGLQAIQDRRGVRRDRGQLALRTRLAQAAAYRPDGLLRGRETVVPASGRSSAHQGAEHHHHDPLLPPGRGIHDRDPRLLPTKPSRSQHAGSPRRDPGRPGQKKNHGLGPRPAGGHGR